MAVKFVALVSLALSVAACAQTPSESPAPSNQTSTATTASPAPSAAVDQQAAKPDSGTPATAAGRPPELEKAGDATATKRGDEVELPAGTTVRTTLQEPLKVVVPLTKPAQR